MKSLKELYKIGRGPSSSYTMGPQLVSKMFLEKYLHVHSYEVAFCGSLVATDKGYMIDVTIIDVLEVNHRLGIVRKPGIFLPFYPNGAEFKAFGDHQELLGSWVIYSVGGGALSEGKGDDDLFNIQGVYDLNTMKDIMKWCETNSRSYWEYVAMCKGDDIWDYLMEYWDVVKAAMERNVDREGTLPGPLNLHRKAPSYYVKATGYKRSLQARGLVYAYVLGVSEENASGGTIITALTCGTSGVIPAMLYRSTKGHEFNDMCILRAMAAAGLFGNVAKHDASISGVNIGCQDEVGVACVMVIVATYQLFGNSTIQIEYTTEMGLEHHLGMTCDLVCGLVQIPYIGCNAFAAARTLDTDLYSSFSDGKHRVLSDKVVRVMERTGHDLLLPYKEISEGRLVAEKF